MRVRIAVIIMSWQFLSAEEWSQFRGPNGAGVADTRRLPVRFDPRTNVVWKTNLPPGHSSPVVFGDRIVLTGVEGGTRAGAGRDKVVDEGGQLVTICLDRRSGRILWRAPAPRPRLERYQPTNSPASPSPVLDGRAAYVFFGDFGLLAYRLSDGSELWRHPLGPFNNVNGHGTSPILYRNSVVLICDQDTGSYLIAVDKDTGKTIWKTERPEFTRSYSTPALLHPAQGPTELIVPGSYQLTGYNAATGEKLWWIRGLSWQPKSAPVVDGGMIYAHSWEQGGEAETQQELPSFEELLKKYDANHDGKLSADELTGDPRLQRGLPNIDLASDGLIDERDWSFYRAQRASRNRLIAVRHGGRGDLTGSNVIWSIQKFLPNVPSPLLYEGVLYLVKDGGIITSLDPKTGTILKQGRATGALDTYYSSPIGGAGKIYFLSEGGKAVVLKAGAQWEILGVNDLEEPCYATPAVVGNRMYVRTHSWLYCFEEK